MEKSDPKRRKNDRKSVIEEVVSEVLEKGQPISKTALALTSDSIVLAEVKKR